MGLFRKKASKKKTSWIKKALIVNKVAWAGVKQLAKKVAPKTYAKVQTVVNTIAKNSEVRKASRQYKKEVRQKAREEKKTVRENKREAIKNAGTKEEMDAIREDAKNKRNKINEAKKQINDIIEQNKDEEILKNKSNRDEIVEKISEAETEEEIDEAKADIADQVIRQLEYVTNDGRDKEIEIILDTTGKQKDVWLQEAALEVSYYLENSDFGADGFGTPDIDLEMESEFNNFLTGMRDFSEDTFNEHRDPNSTFILVDGLEKSESIYAGVPTKYRNNLIELKRNGLDPNVIWYDNLSWKERRDILQRTKDSSVGYAEDSTAIDLLETVLFDKRTEDMTREEVMLQYAMQFNGDEYFDGSKQIEPDEYIKYGVDKVAAMDLFEEEYKLPYENGTGYNDDSFDTYNDCSGFVQELYYNFYGQGLASKDGDDYETSGDPQTQYETFRNYGQGKQGDVEYFKAAPKQYKALEMDESEMMMGDVIYYNKHSWIDHDRKKKTPDVINYKKTDHVVMSLGNGWVIEEKGHGYGTVISKMNQDKIVGYSIHFPDYLEGDKEE